MRKFPHAGQVGPPLPWPGRLAPPKARRPGPLAGLATPDCSHCQRASLLGQRRTGPPGSAIGVRADRRRHVLERLEGRTRLRERSASRRSRMTSGDVWSAYTHGQGAARALGARLGVARPSGSIEPGRDAPDRSSCERVTRPPADSCAWCRPEGVGRRPIRTPGTQHGPLPPSAASAADRRDRSSQRARARPDDSCADSPRASRSHTHRQVVQPTP